MVVRMAGHAHQGLLRFVDGCSDWRLDLGVILLNRDEVQRLGLALLEADESERAAMQSLGYLTIPTVSRPA